MKKCFIPILLLLLSAKTYAQHHAGLYLSSYLYTSASTDFASVKSFDGSPLQKVSLSGRDAHAFTLSKNNKLHIKAAARRSGKPLHIELNAQVEGVGQQQQFTILKDQFVRNKVIAHRGAWKHTGATENSLASLNHAVDLGCSGSEFDVHMSSDSVLFIHHDPIIQGLKIEETSSEKLGQLKLDNGEIFPTLEAYLSAGLKQHKTRLILEIKPSVISKARAIDLTHKVLDLVTKMHAEAWVDYISFDYDVCKEVIKMAPYAKVSYLNGDKTPAELAAEHFYGFDYYLKVLRAHPEWIKEAKALNLDVNVWTVNEEADMDFFLQEGANVLTTNEPELLLRKAGT
jgi:glycerophosphoryl diester phosphodiesterase